MDTDVAFEDEISEYFQNEMINNEAVLVKQIIKNPKQIYIDEIKNISDSFSSSFLDQNDENFKLYIEYTNPSITWTNSESVTDEEKSELASSYNLAKVKLKSASCSVFTDSKSQQLYVPSDLGPYIVKNRLDAINHSGSIKSPISTPAKSYKFDLTTSHVKTSISDGPKEFSAELLITLDATFEQKHEFTRIERVENANVSPTTSIVNPLSPQPQTTNIYPSSFKTSQESSSDQKLLKNISNPLNIYSYTGDIGQGNVASSYKTGSKGTYVKYIQLTLRAAGYDISIDGEYGPQTQSRIKTFQNANKILNDGVVDSQTKYYLGLVWSSMSQDMVNLYLANIRNNDYKDKNIDKFVEAAAKTKSASNALADGTKLQLINFTGIEQDRDPKEAVIWVAFKLPGEEYVSSIQSVIIKPSSRFASKASDYDGIEVTNWRVGKSGEGFNNNLFKVKGSQSGPKRNRNNGAEININLGSSDYKNRWIYLRIKGSALGSNFGGAEGIAIDDIRVVGSFIPPSTPVTTQPIPDQYKSVFYSDKRDVSGTIVLQYSANSISASEQTILIEKEILKQSGKLSSIDVYEVLESNFSNITLPTYSGLNVQLNNNSYKPNTDRIETVDLSNIKSFNIINIQVLSLRTANVEPSQAYPTAKVSIISNLDNSFGIYIPISEYTTNSPFVVNNNITNYFTKKLVTGKIDSGINTINYYDGTVLICKQDGSPYPIVLNPSSSGQDSSTAINYSDIKVVNNYGDQPGLIYGFFREDTKEFLGKSISYNKYRENPAKTYVALYAYDYDGDINTISDFDGAIQSTIPPVTVPKKVVYPVYKVKSKKSNKIQLMPVQENLTKRQPWPIMISSGSFLKDIKIDDDYKKQWYWKYSGQTLTASYDTSKISSIAWSKVFGFGFYDVVNESPIILSNRSIKLRQSSLHYIHLPSNDLERFTTPFKYIINIYTRASESSPWSKISNSYIKDINCATGVIELNQSIIPSNEKLIKVDYTIKLNGIPIKQCGGQVVPINPFLNRDTVKLNKPLYIYLMPAEVYKGENLSSSNNEVPGQYQKIVKVSEYSASSIVNFTYDNNIFNKLDLVNYNPFALLIGVIYVTNNLEDKDFSVTDLRIKGGGITSAFNTNKILSDIDEAISYWDVYPPLSEAYPKGGYIIVKIPNSVKKNFTNPDEVYTIVRDNLTAGVVFELQDMEGKDWGSSVTISS